MGSGYTSINDLYILVHIVDPIHNRTSKDKKQTNKKNYPDDLDLT